MRRRLIVNADDFGLTDGVNRGVIEGHVHGIITSATLMANGGAFDSAVELASRAEGLGVGVHLNLVDGVPVAGPDRVPTLVGRDGAMANPPGTLALRVARGSVSLADVDREVRAQIAKVRRAGIEPTHVDGHKHAHMWPAIFEVVARAARDCGIRAIRCGGEPWSAIRLAVGSGRATALVGARQYLGARVLARLAAVNSRTSVRFGLAAPERLLGVTHTGLLSAPALRRLLLSFRASTGELMCHPGYVDAALRDEKTRLRESREHEVAALTSEAIRNLIDRESIELISYAGLGDPL